MEDKSKVSDTINNICTLLGAGLMLYPIINEATKTIIPEMQKLSSGETLQDLKSLPAGQEKHDVSDKESSEYDMKHDTERKKYDDELAELKKKLAEYESKTDESKSEN